MSKNSDEYLSISTPSDLAKFKNMAENGDGVKLNNLFGGRRRSRKSRKSSKGSKGSRKSKRSQRRASRKSRRGSRKGSRKSRRSQRRASRKSRRGSRKGSRKSRKASRRQSRASRKKSRKSRRKSRRSKRSQRRVEGEEKKKRTLPEGVKAFSELAKYVASKSGIKFGRVAMKVAKHYNDKAKQQNPGKTAVENAKIAKELFDKSSQDEKNRVLQAAQ